MTARAEKAEAELAELKSPGKIASQLKAVRDVLGVPDTLSRPLHLYVADLIASRDRLATYVRADDALFLTAVNENASAAERLAMDKARRTARAAVDAAGDLGGAA